MGIKGNKCQNLLVVITSMVPHNAEPQGAAVCLTLIMKDSHLYGDHNEDNNEGIIRTSLGIMFLFPSYFLSNTSWAVYSL